MQREEEEWRREVKGCRNENKNEKWGRCGKVGDEGGEKIRLIKKENNGGK